MLLEAIKSVLSQKVKFLIAGLGISWSVFIIILSLGVSNSINSTAKKTLIYFKNTIIYLMADTTSKPFNGNPSGTPIYFTEQDILHIKASIPSIKNISTNAGNYLYIYNKNRKSLWKRVTGVKIDYFNIIHSEIVEGRLLNKIDFQRKRKVCVINQEAAQILFGEKTAIGAYLYFEEEQFKIVGVVKDPIVNASDSEMVFIPYSTYCKLYNVCDTIKTLVVSIDNLYTGMSAKKIVDKIRVKLALKNGFHPEDYKTIQFYHTEPIRDNFTNFSIVFKIFVWFLSISILLCSMIGVSSTIIAITKERTKEIGIKKALGAQKVHIIKMFLLESVVVTLAFGIIGMIISYITLMALSAIVMNLELNLQAPFVSWQSIILYIFILAISGIISGIYPAIKAANLKAIEAIRYE